MTIYVLSCRRRPNGSNSSASLCQLKVKREIETGIEREIERGRKREREIHTQTKSGAGRIQR